MTKSSKIYVFLMLGLFPLVTLGEYQSILGAKWLFSLAVNAIYVLLLAICLANNRIKNKECQIKELARTNSGKALLVSIIAYATSLIVGLMLCEHTRQNLWGLGARYLGVLPLVLSLVAMLGVAIYYKRSKLAEWGFGIACGIVYSLQILNGLGVDPLGMKTGMLDSQELFASTIGNLNFNATFDCVTVAIFVATLAVSSWDGKSLRLSKLERVVTAILAILGIVGAVSLECYGAILGIGAALLVIIGYFISKRSMKACKAFAVGTIVIIVAFATIWLVQATDHSGHNRVFIWRKTLEMFAAFPLMQKLFGCGINEYQYAIYDFCGAEMEADGYNIFIDAHSEYLQALATSGIVGTAGYIGILIASLKRGFEIIKRNEDGLLAIALVVAFMAQGLVYNPTITTTPIVFVQIGLIWNNDRTSEI